MRFLPPRLVSRVDAASIIIRHKVLKNCWTRCDHADRAVVLEKLWWKIFDFAALWRSSVTFYNVQEPETAISRWARARIRAAEVGKGLSKDEKTKKLLSFKYWLEAIDPLHRHGNNLHKYYVAWNNGQSPQPFFDWLDFGDGKEITLEKCSRTNLRLQRVKYLGPKEREAYEVIVDRGKLVYRQSGSPVDTPEGTKWIFVLSTLRQLYVGKKKTGWFQHSSFLAGGVIVAAGRVVASNGVLQAIRSCSGHYRPTEENFMELTSFLEQNHVDLSLVKTFPIDGSFAPGTGNVSGGS